MDAEGGVTDHTRNAFGEDSRVTQYAVRLDVATDLASPGPWAAVATTTASANPGSAIGHDRSSVIRYDRRGLKQSEQQQDVLLGVVTGGDATNQQAGWRAANVLTDYQYDGVGNVLSVLGNAYDVSSGARLQSTAEQLSFYDALGRLTASVQIGASSLADRATSFRHDALGNTVLSTRHANLASVTRTAAGSTSPYTRYTLTLPTASADDQTTRQAFDPLGRVLRSRDAMGNDQYFSYDAAGHVAKQWRPFLAGEAGVDGQALNAIQVFAYDKLGRQTETRTLLQREAGAAATYSSDIAQYNPFGEITAKLRDENIADATAAVRYAYYDYDNGGRLWRTNAGEGTAGGVDTVYQYNLQDKVTAVITSPTLDLRAYANAQAVPTTLAGGVRRTTSTYDRLGRLREQRDLGATHLDGSTTARQVSQTYDAWGNTLAVTTSRGYITTYRYNALNQAIEEKLPTTTYYSDHDTHGDSDPGNDVAGSAVTARPTSTRYIDAWGRTLGSTDARGKTSTSHYTTTGQLDYEYHADGGTVRHVYDNLGRETARYTADWFSGDANSRLYSYTYDRLDRLLTESVYGRTLFHANGADDRPDSFTWTRGTATLGSYRYDALGHRISETSGAADNQADATTRYYFDTAGRLVKSATPLKTLQYGYDAAGRKTGETDALGQVTRYQYSDQGRLTSKLDIGGATTQFAYDRSGALLTQTNDRGQDLAYAYYDDGRLKTVTDRWADSRSTYDYDADGNKTVDRFVTGASTANPLKYRDVAMGYDELGRLRRVTDTATGTGTLADYDLTIQYDANGNRYRVMGSTRDNDRSGMVDDGGAVEYGDPDGLDRRKVDQLFAYDAMNRQTGQRSLSYSGSTEITTWKFFSYDKDGSRIREEQRFANTGAAGALTGRVVKYGYDLAGRVSEANVISKTSNGSGGDVPNAIERPHRKVIYSASAGFMQEWQWAKTGPVDSMAYTDQDPDRIYTTETRYNTGQAITQVVGRLKVGSGAWYLTSNQTQVLDAAGNLVAMHVDGYQAQSTSLASTLDYAYTYLKMDGYLQRSARVSGQQWNGAQLAAVTPVVTTQDYDVNGRLLQVRDDNNATQTGEQFLVIDNSGHIVMKVQNRSATAMAAHKATGTYDPATGAHGSAGGTSAPTRPAVPSLAAYLSGSTIVSSNVQRMRYANEQVIGTTDEVHSMAKQVWLDESIKPIRRTIYVDTDSTGMRIEDALSAADVKLSAGGGLQYTWNSGDTLRGLAQTFYGDAALWYVIAEANGVADDSEIAAGTVMSLPNVTRSANTASTLKVYDPGRIIGDTNPEPIAPPPPPPPGGGGCGGLGMVLVIVVAVVATVLTAGAAAMAMAGTLSGASLGGVMAAGGAVFSGGVVAGAVAGTTLSAAGMVGAAVIGGAVGSIASQGVAIAAGMQESFSWKQVGQAALGGAVTAGIGQMAQAGGMLQGLQGSGAWASAGRAALSSGANQALRGHWSWREIVASAVGAGAGAAAGNAIGNSMGSVGRGIAAGFVGGVAGQWAGPGGKANYGSTFASTLGSVLGDQIAGGMASDRNLSNGNYRNEMDRESDAYSPVFNYNYRNGSDVESDIAYDARRAQDEYTGGRDFAAYLAGHRRVTNEQAPAGADSALPGVPASGPMEEPPILGWMSSRSNRFDTRLPILGPSTLAKPDGSPGTYTFDRSTGEVYWDLGKENTVHAIPLAYKRPTWDEAVNDPSNPWAQGPRMGNVLADAALFTAGGVAGMFTGGWAFAAMRGAGYGLLGAGATAGVVGDLTAQAGDNLAWLASDGQLGRSGINGTELAISAGLGALPGLPGAIRGWAGDLRGLGVPDWNIRFASRQPGVLYSNPLPFELVARESGPGLRAPFVDFDAVDALAPGLYRADPQQLRFMQPTVSPNYSVGGHTIASTADDLRLGRVTPDDLGDPLRVVMHEGKPFSFDNRRLLSYSLADVREAPIQVMGLDDPLFARRVDARFDPINGQGLRVVVATSRERPAAMADLYQRGMIQRPR